ncbi:MAG: transposase [Proteobacteria bacterium]|nr:MAG: transposase [Pseudomonadota bacterium]
MIFPRSPVIYVASAPVDLRWGLDKLASLVVERFRLGPRDGAFFLFLNKTRTKLRVLHFDKTGAWLLSKRLDRGTFPQPLALRADATHVELSVEELDLLLQGLAEKPVVRH